MKEDHNVKDCNVMGKICVHCGERDKHHRTLCPKKLKQRQEKEHLPNNTMIAGDILPEQDSKTTTYGETTMLSDGEHVVMQTALVEAISTNHSASEVTKVLMETGSSRTYVTEEIAQKLNLRPNESINITIYTTGASKPKEILSLVVIMAIKSKVNANVAPKISGNIQRMPIQLKNQFSVQKRFKLADTLPQRTESSTIMILVGGDYKTK